SCTVITAVSCPPHLSSSFFFHGHRDPRDLHSFPTRRSSDLVTDALQALALQELDRHAAVVEHAEAGRALARRVVQSRDRHEGPADRKSTRLNSSHDQISYAVFCLKKKKRKQTTHQVS